MTTRTETTDYFGGVVEDLQLPPTVCLAQSTSVGEALNLAERGFTIIPIVDSSRNLEGYIDLSQLIQKVQSSEIKDEETVSAPKAMKRFAKKKKYRVITPYTPLEELESFLETFPFAIVTDDQRKFVLAIVTREDLKRFRERRFPNRSTPVPPS
ncbi:hypothetical protein BT69DRAFT_1246900 [Atractiella rhizophila]|nr:hypothetical protein BT69DRAFT_1246900 [Atractiella rhizophila]